MSEVNKVVVQTIDEDLTFHIKAGVKGFEAQIWEDDKYLIAMLDGDEVSRSPFELLQPMSSRPSYIGVVTSSFVTEERRGKGLGSLLYSMTWDALKELNHGDAVLLPFKSVALHDVRMETSKQADRVWKSLTNRGYYGS